ncbi:hypothetical protein QBC41DRAFT_31845 [Cercophora samala]|uniref:Uncharacterized protein n=1 Tax=Cercophora samala TaxID=330535 RepID=A0AA40D6L9_9PEZI|nr:hypothetical protein QBC41DRAFT_31845 [Cercophora samala]
MDISHVQPTQPTYLGRCGRGGIPSTDGISINVRGIYEISFQYSIKWTDLMKNGFMGSGALRHVKILLFCCRSGGGEGVAAEMHSSKSCMKPKRGKKKKPQNLGSPDFRLRCVAARPPVFPRQSPGAPHQQPDVNARLFSCLGLLSRYVSESRSRDLPQPSMLLLLGRVLPFLCVLFWPWTSPYRFCFLFFSYPFPFAPWCLLQQA